MSADPSSTPPRRKPSILRWLGGGFVILVVLFLYQQFGPSPRIVVSKQTTFVTEPLRPDGLPDYEEYVRRQLSEDVTPENNAAALVFIATWPAHLEPKQYRAVADELRLKDLPSSDRRKYSLIRIYRTALRHARQSSNAVIL